MIRRLVEISGSYYVALPKSWVRMLNMEKGSTIELTLTESGIIVRPPRMEEKAPPRQIRLRVAHGIGRQIIAAYLMGYDLIEVFDPNGIAQEYRREIEKVTDLLIGLEVVREDSKSLLLECLWLRKGGVWNYIRRMDFIARSMYKDAISGLLDHDINLLQNVIERDIKVDKLYFLVVRMIRSMLLDLGSLLHKGINLLRLLDYRLIAKNVEEIADYSEDMARRSIAILSQRLRLPTAIERLYEITCEIEKLEDRVMHAYETAEVSAVPDFISIIHSLKDDISSLERKLSHRSNELRSITEYLFRIIDLIADVSDLLA